MQSQPTLRELSLDELEQVGGAGVSAEWGVSTATAVAFTVGAATITAPFLAGAFAFAGVATAGAALFFALDDADLISV